MILRTLLFCLLAGHLFGQNIPLAEHPRPDFERTQWQNLNGTWQFEFDSLNKGESQNWQLGKSVFPHQIQVPFPWGSALSGVKDLADIGWYKKEISIDPSWDGKRIFVNIGASDWETKVWLDGQFLGSHQGGYTPFDFEITDYVKAGKTHQLIIKADDIRRDFTLYGKQGYGNARGIWQTVYLEARGKVFFEHIHFTPDIDRSELKITAYFTDKATADEPLSFEINKNLNVNGILKKGRDKAELTVKIPDAHLWTLEDPYLYDVIAKTSSDAVKSYFGMRKISVVNLPSTDIPYVALNNKPIYLQLTLDQSYHPEGFYTFPTDEFMKNEIVLCKNIGINGIRTHIKVDIPRKLYWADKLGMLVMSDLPNSWGEPDEPMQKEAEYTLREMIKRDYNHPAIFSWIVFNETWGLKSKVENPQTQKEESKYLPSTQQWVAGMYYLAKSLDNTRLAEDNSICCGAGHTVTDINSWHEYRPGYAWEEHMQTVDKGTYPGSSYHFEEGFVQGNQPMINSECGNVWGYIGSTGDVDWSYDYHRMMNTFRMHPKMAGWLYTEHHDVINEWNGYWRFDRSPKYTGLSDLVPGMKDKDFHSLVYLSTGQDIGFKAKANATVKVPLFLSSMTDEPVAGGKMTIQFTLSGNDVLGQKVDLVLEPKTFDYKPWMQESLGAYELKMPAVDGMYILQMKLTDQSGKVWHHNFVNYQVSGGQLPSNVRLIEKSPAAFSDAKWTSKQWNVLDGKKANGAGKGHFTYEFTTNEKAKSAYLLVEMGAKELFAKDREGAVLKDVDYMLGGIADPSQNPNAYPMTDDRQFSSNVSVYIGDMLSQKLTLADDPADHRGLLSWQNQKEDGTLHEAGSYGYLTKIPLSKARVKMLNKTGKISLKLETTNEGGLAIYGKDFGRFGINPSLVLQK